MSWPSCKRVGPNDELSLTYKRRGDLGRGVHSIDSWRQISPGKNWGK